MWKIKKAQEVKETESTVCWEEVVRVLFLIQGSGLAAFRDDI